MTPEPPFVSVVIATYNRPTLVERLLSQLAEQTLPPEHYELIAVDDGSEPPVDDRLRELEMPCALTVIRIPNSGAAAARDRGVNEARGRIVVILDDDMEVGPDFLAAHLRGHGTGEPRVVLGLIRPHPSLARMPLFERYHASTLARHVEGVKAGVVKLQGTHLCTGNVSFPRDEYLRVGGFDSSLTRSEDAELGVRFQKAGLTFLLSEEAYSIHGSDHGSLRVWMRRAFLYGISDLRIARKHPDLTAASPWRFIDLVHPVSRWLLQGVLVFPRIAFLAARLVMGVSLAADRLGLERPAIAGTTLAYGIEYFRGVRVEAGSLRAALDSRPPRT